MNAPIGMLIVLVAAASLLRVRVSLSSQMLPPMGRDWRGRLMEEVPVDNGLLVRFLSWVAEPGHPNRGTAVGLPLWLLVVALTLRVALLAFPGALR